MDADSEEKKQDNNYDYDLIVIGGGSGGIACAKQAAKNGAKVALFDYVVPTDHGTTWGLGGTCVNVGCIPKKLMHYSGLLKQCFWDAKKLGWEFEEPKFKWEKMLETVNNYVRSLNFQYRVQMNENNIDYVKAYAKFVDPHTLEFEKKKGEVQRKSGKYIVLAMGGRPYIPPNLVGRGLAITSDDIFWWPKHPGKVLCVGASYISLECGGFLHEVGCHVTIAVRSILLRGFDRECSDFIGNHMKSLGVKFYQEYVPIKLAKTKDDRIEVTFQSQAEEDFDTENNRQREFVEVFDTVLYATGRAPETKKINLQASGVEVDEQNGKIRTNREQTNVPHIYAVGDIVYEGLELTPVAIASGKLLADRLFKNVKNFMDYTKIPTTVFTPLEYSCVGYSEEQARAIYDDDELEVYHMKQNPLEHYACKRVDEKGEELSNTAFYKVICLKSKKEQIIGLHYCGPNAGEVMQGFALAVRLGATKSDLNRVVGIHPTNAEWFTVMTVTKSSGASADATAC